MTPEQVSLVQDSFAKVLPIADTAADLFYDRLFELDPALRALFPEDLREQKKKLMTMLRVAVTGLSDTKSILPAVEALGRRHAAYGVSPEHYTTVGAALLDTLEKGLGDAFSAPVKQAWEQVYGILSSTMLSAANTEPAQ